MPKANCTDESDSAQHQPPGQGPVPITTLTSESSYTARSWVRDEGTAPAVASVHHSAALPACPGTGLASKEQKD